jgi:hypothetical protein
VHIQSFFCYICTGTISSVPEIKKSPMKNRIVLFLGLCLLIFSAGDSVAQQKVRTELTSVKQKGKDIDFTITSSKPFIFGSNRYVFHVADKKFFLHRQFKENGKGVMVFFVPADDFEGLREGAGMFLTYGDGANNEHDLEHANKMNPVRCASLGKFSKQLLTK